MREIKFKAINKRTQETEIITDLYWFEENQVHSNGGNDWFLLEFTGLKDKNGVEIYEGDIVKWGHIEGGIELSGVRVAIVSLFPSLRFEAFKPIKHTFEFGCFAYKSTHKYLEVIGSIYENPELIEDKS